MRKMTAEEYSQRFHELVGDEYSILDPYDGASKKIRIRHNRCGRVYPIVPSEFLRGSRRCQECRKEDRRKKKLAEFIDFINKKYPGEYKVLSKTFVNNTTEIKVKHIPCGNTYKVLPKILKRQNICSACHGGVAKTQEEFDQDVKNAVGDEYTFLEPYVNSATKIKCRHNKCGYEWNITPNEFLNQGVRCRKCSGHLPYTEADFLRDIKAKYGDDYKILSHYTTKHGEITVQHKCGYTYTTEARRLLEGHGCSKCAHNLHLSLDELKEKLKEKFGNEYTILSDNYETVHSKITVRHNRCGNIWPVKANNLLYGYGCSACNQSKGEKMIRILLEQNHKMAQDKDYFYGYILPNRLHLDFYLPELSLAFEYDGEQHYRPVDFFGGEQAFKNLQERDHRKDQYCKEHNIKLVRIPYTTRTKEDIAKVLNQYLD